MKINFLKSRGGKILFLFFGIAILSGGFFYFQKMKYPEINQSIETETGYQIKITKEGKLVENKNYGVSFIIPSDWYLKGTGSDSEISFYSPNTKNNLDNYSLTSGRRITASITEIDFKLDILEKKLREKFSWPSIAEENYERIKIQNWPAIKHSFLEKELQMFFIGIHIPVNQKLYEFILDSSLKDKDYCQQEFLKLVASLHIKNQGVWGE